MEFGVVAAGVLIGKGWSWLVGRQVSSCGGMTKAPMRQLYIHVLLAALAGTAVALIEIQLAPVGELSSLLSKGLIAGFAWSTWFLAGARVLYARHHPAGAAAYVVAAPILTLAAVLAGYLSIHLEQRLG